MSRALILAAGQGTRLNHSRPKPLYPLLGLPLLARTLFTLERAGITDAYVVVGYEGERIRQAIERVGRLTIRVHWLHNPAWDRPNGHSVLAAEGLLDEPFILTMGDHVFDAAIVDTLLAHAPALRGVALAVDRDLARVVDLADATKVLDGSGAITAIGKSLDRYTAVDTGVFLASPALFAAVREACAAGQEALSDGVQRLADRGLAVTADVTGMLWQDVDTPRDARAAERKLLDSARKPADGPVSRYLNRPISLALSRWFLRWGVAPNLITLLHLALGVAAGVVAAVGGYVPFLVSGILFQLASVVDGSDGEVAKLAYRNGPGGDWLDTVADNITYVVWLAGLTMGVERAGLSTFFTASGIAAFGLTAAALASLYVFLLRRRRSGSLLAVEYRFWDRQDPLSRFVKAGEPFMRRDVFAFLFMLLGVLGLLPLALPLTATGALFALGLSIEANLALRGAVSGERASVRRLSWEPETDGQPVRSGESVETS